MAKPKAKKLIDAQTRQRIIATAAAAIQNRSSGVLAQAWSLAAAQEVVAAIETGCDLVLKES